MTHCSSRSSVSLVILAAGLGRRFGGNKQLATVGDTGKPLMYFSVMDAYQAGVRNLVLVINQQIEQAILDQFLPLLPVDLEVSLVEQRSQDLPVDCGPVSRQKPWGTGHALWCARERVQADCIVVNADDYYGPVSMRQLLSHFENRGDWAMVNYRLENTLSDFGVVNRGLCEQIDGALVAVRECLSIAQVDGVIRGRLDGNAVQLDPATSVSMNIWGFTRDIFKCLEAGLARFLARAGDDPQLEFYLPNQVMASIKAGECSVSVYHSQENWQGITYQEDLQRLAAYF